MTKTINVAKEFGKYLAGRIKSDSDRSGEHFYEEILHPNFSTNDILILDFRECQTAPSFIDEAFRRLYNEFKRDLNNNIKIIAQSLRTEKQILNVLAGRHIFENV